MSSALLQHNVDGVLLFAHGSRDAGWAAPFERVRALLTAQGETVELAYLERMTPDFATAAAALASRGCQRAVVVPAFLGQGAHVREDLPRLVAAANAALPQLRLRLAPPVGESDVVLAAIAATCVNARTRR